MDHLHQYDTDAEYQLDKYYLDVPNVSLTSDNGNVYYGMYKEFANYILCSDGLEYRFINDIPSGVIPLAIKVIPQGHIDKYARYMALTKFNFVSLISDVSYVTPGNVNFIEGLNIYNSVAYQKSLNSRGDNLSLILDKHILYSNNVTNGSSPYSYIPSSYNYGDSTYDESPSVAGEYYKYNHNPKGANQTLYMPVNTMNVDAKVQNQWMEPRDLDENCIQYSLYNTDGLSLSIAGTAELNGSTVNKSDAAVAVNEFTPYGGSSITSISKWYIPSIGELGYVATQLLTINSLLQSLADKYNGIYTDGSGGQITISIPIYNSDGSFTHKYIMSSTFTSYQDTDRVTYNEAHWRLADGEIKFIRDDDSKNSFILGGKDKGIIPFISSKDINLIN